MWAMGGGDDDAQEEWRRRMKPDNELPASLVLDVVLAETPVVVISLATAQVYRNGVDLEIDIRARENIGSNGFIGEDVLVGVEFSDGRRATNLPMVHGRTPPSSDDAVLAMGGGGGGQRSASVRLFLTPLPSPGELKLICASPRRNVQETATLLDADAIRAASSRARELWPWEPYGEYQPPDPPPPPLGGWFEATQGRADAPDARRLLPPPTEGPSTHDRPVHGTAARGALLGLLAVSAVSCGAGSPRDVHLQSATVTRADQRLLRIDVAACNSQPYEVHATESAVAVKVRITTTQPQGQAAAPSCSDGISLRLAQPIGSRVLIDLTTGHQVPLGPLPTARP